MSKIVDRTLDFIELFAKERRPLSLSEMANLLDIPISSCHDVVQAMQSRGYLYEIAPRAGYYPTLRLSALGKEIGENDPVLMRCELLLRSLRDALDEFGFAVKGHRVGRKISAGFRTHPPVAHLGQSRRQHSQHSWHVCRESVVGKLG